MKKHLLIRVAACVILSLSMIVSGIAVIPAADPDAYEVQAAQKVKLSKTKLTFYVKQTAALKVTGTKKKVKWSTSNKKVATVTSKGKVTAVKKGTATITAKVDGKKLTCKVTVKNPTLSATSITLTEGSKKQLKVNNAVGTVKWSSSSKAVAAVTAKGVVTAVKKGTAAITALASGVKLTCKVKVNAKPAVPVSSVTLDQPEIRLFEGESKTLTATVLPENAANKAVTWSTGNAAVAAVAGGKVTGVSQGTTTITVTTKDGNKKASCKVSVIGDVNPADLKEKDRLSVCLATEPYTMDPGVSTAVDEAAMLSHLFSGLARWEQKPDGTLTIAPDLSENLAEPVDNGNGTFTYTYTLRDAKWSDGQPVKAEDFVFAWKRATSSELRGEYAYLFEYVNGYEKYPAFAENNLDVKALDEKTLQVVTCGDYPFWNELLAFPAFFPVREDVAGLSEDWAKDAATFVSNGMYTMKSWTHEAEIVLAKNPDHPDAQKVTMPEIRFVISEDAEGMLQGFKAGELALIDDVYFDQVSSKDPVLHIDGTMGTYYMVGNVNQDLSPVSGTQLTTGQQAEVRRALSLLIDRNAIASDGRLPASSFVAAGILEPDGSQFYQHAGHSSAYIGYYRTDEAGTAANKKEAMEILAKYYSVQNGKVTNFPELTYIYNSVTGHQRIAEYLKAVFNEAGITLKLKSMEWDVYQEALKEGNYTFARGGWIADYSDALSFLDMWTSTSLNNQAFLGKDGHASKAVYNMDLSGIDGYAEKSVTGGTWAETYDELVGWIVKEKNMDVRCKLMHAAEDLLMETGCMVPLYYYTDVYLLSPNVSGFFTTPFGGKYFMYTTVK